MVISWVLHDCIRTLKGGIRAVLLFGGIGPAEKSGRKIETSKEVSGLIRGSSRSSRD